PQPPASSAPKPATASATLHGVLTPQAATAARGTGSGTCSDGTGQPGSMASVTAITAGAAVLLACVYRRVPRGQTAARATAHRGYAHAAQSSPTQPPATVQRQGTSRSRQPE